MTIIRNRTSHAPGRILGILLAACMLPAAAAAERERYIVTLEAPTVVDRAAPAFREMQRMRRQHGDFALQGSQAASEVDMALGAVAHEQKDMLDLGGELLGRKLTPGRRYTHALNGFTLELSAREAERLAALPGIRAVERDRYFPINTDVGPRRIEAEALWSGDWTDEGGVRGEGIVIGIIDTGIDPDHPAFSQHSDAGTGYQHQNPLGQYFGACDPGSGQHDSGFPCNDKLIGAWVSLANPADAPDGARDFQGHGTHVAGTAAGNPLSRVNSGTNPEVRYNISGIAPRANIISYLACIPGADGGGSCPHSATVKAVDQAIEDGVDVINFSIGGTPSPWSGTMAAAFRRAYDAGVLVSASAGNSGADGSVNNTVPWVATVGGSSHGRRFGWPLSLLEGGVPSTTELPVFLYRYNGDLDNEQDFDLLRLVDVEPDNEYGCEDITADLSGTVLLVRRGGGCNFTTKSVNAKNAGAGVLIVHNDAPGQATSIITPQAVEVPTFRITYSSDLRIRDWQESEASPPVQIGIQRITDIDREGAERMWSTSSRGPIDGEDFLKPDFAAPANAVAAAHITPDFEDIRLVSGTSMAAPHVAGALALLRQLRPDWSVRETISALAMSAEPVLVLQGSNDPVPAFSQGSGRINVRRAASVGLLMEETFDEIPVVAPPAGFDPGQMNLPGLVRWDCEAGCSWTRTLHSAGDTTRTWEISVDSGSAMDVVVTPTGFVLGANESAEIGIQVTPAADHGGGWHEFSVRIDDSSGDSPQLRLAGIVRFGDPVEDDDPPPGPPPGSSGGSSGGCTVADGGGEVLLLLLFAALAMRFLAGQRHRRILR
jgi:subtilisin family serine protease